MDNSSQRPFRLKQCRRISEYALLDTIARMNEKVCEHIETHGALPAAREKGNEYYPGVSWEKDEHELFLVRPLFRAIAIVINLNDLH